MELLGISGIGKTAIALRLIEEIKPEFDYIIYQTIGFSLTLERTLTSLLDKFGENTQQLDTQQLEGKIAQLFDYLRNYRCLIVLDDVQTLFSPGQLAGEYQPSLGNYPLFFKRIAETRHNSCFLLISSEKIGDFTLGKAERPLKTLALGGLGVAAKEILTEYQLSDEAHWERLIDTYQGNPLWLELTAIAIQDLFGGKVSEFMQCQGLILSNTLRSQLERQWQRLTPTERAIMIQLNDEDAPVTLQQILKTVNLATSDVLTGIQSLSRRLLLDSIRQGQVKYFQLNPVYQQYLKERSNS